LIKSEIQKHDINALVNQAYAFEPNGHLVQHGTIIYFAIITAELGQRQPNKLWFTHAGITIIVMASFGVTMDRQYRAGCLSWTPCVCSMEITGDLSDRLLRLFV
jgi:hypothetical protein